MEVKQIAAFANQAQREAIGEEATVINEDLSNIVDAGNEIFNANAVDNYVKSLVNTIGRFQFVQRAYRGRLPRLLRNAWEWGSVMEKVQMDLPEAIEDQSWDLQNLRSYDTQIFYKPSVSAKFFNDKLAFSIPMSITEKQVKQSLTGPEAYSSFVSMIYTQLENSGTIKVEEVTRRAVNNAMAAVIYDEYNGQNYTTKSGVRAINLLYEYNTENSTTLTQAEAIKDPAFIRYAVYRIGTISDRMKSATNLYNLGGKTRFTPGDMQECVMLTDFEKAAGVFLYSAANQYNTENITLPEHETVPFWQGIGDNYAFDDVSAINVTDTDGNTTSLDGIVCCLYDREAIAVFNEYKKVTVSPMNDVGDFYTVRHKYEISLMNDFNEQIVVFFLK